MNILFLTLGRINDIDEKGIYTDLLREMMAKGDKVYIASPVERRFGKKTHLIEQGDCKILKVRTLNIQKTNVVEKGLGTLLLERQFLRAVEKYWGDIRFDLVLYATPPITFNKVIETMKKRQGASTYLLLKDIFPQNAVDLGMFAKHSYFYKLFRKKEEILYAVSDRIGCMSPANVRFLLNNNPEVVPEKVEVFPNSIVPRPYVAATEEERAATKASLEIGADKVVSLYGGNLGKPQGIDFILEVVGANERRKNNHIVIIGDGTEFPKLQRWFEEHRPKNATLKARLPKEEYDKLAAAADIGLIFLDHRFTIPNFPSRLLSYIENAVPVMVASDPNCDMGRIAEEGGFGLWCESNDIKAFDRQLDRLISDASLRRDMGARGREFLEKNYDVRKHIDKLR